RRAGPLAAGRRARTLWRSLATAMSPDLRATVTRWLDEAAGGDAAAASALLPHVYEELRRLARARLRGGTPPGTLGATALVHEAYLRLVDDDSITFRGRGHFFAAAALAMRHVLVDRARRRARLRHGGGLERVGLDREPMVEDQDHGDVLALAEALRRLAQISPRRAKVVELRWFGGLTGKETAEVLGIADATVERDWAFAKA